VTTCYTHVSLPPFFCYFSNSSCLPLISTYTVSLMLMLMLTYLVHFFITVVASLLIHYILLKFLFLLSRWHGCPPIPLPGSQRCSPSMQPWRDLCGGMSSKISCALTCPEASQRVSNGCINCHHFFSLLLFHFSLSHVLLCLSIIYNMLYYITIFA
jgi:hypothetical protein